MRRQPHTCQPTKRFGRLFALSILLPLGCSTFQVETESRFDAYSRDAYPTLILAPPQLHMVHEAYQSYQLASELADVLSLEGRIPTITLWEYDPAREQAGIPAAAVVALVDRVGLSISDILILELRIDETMTTRTVQAPVMMGGGQQHQYERNIAVTLSLVTFAHGELLARVGVDFSDPPFHSEASAANPRPVLREGVRKAGLALIELVADRFVSPPSGAIPEIQMHYNPRELFHYREPHLEPLEARFESMDELDRLASRMVYYQYFDPEISGHAIRLFDALEPGILVRALEGSAVDLGLAVDDYIVEVDGQQVGGRHSLARAFLLAEPGEQLEVSLLRAGRLRRVAVPVHAFSD